MIAKAYHTDRVPFFASRVPKGKPGDQGTRPVPGIPDHPSLPTREGATNHPTKRVPYRCPANPLVALGWPCHGKHNGLSVKSPPFNRPFGDPTGRGHLTRASIRSSSLYGCPERTTTEELRLDETRTKGLENMPMAEGDTRSPGFGFLHLLHGVMFDQRKGQ